MSARPRYRLFPALLACCGLWCLAAPTLAQTPAADPSAGAAPATPGEDAGPGAAAEAPAEPTPQDEIHALLAEFARLGSEIRASLQKMESLDGEERAAVSYQVRERWTEAMRLAHELAARLAATEADGLAVGALRQQVEDALGQVSKALPRLIERGELRLAELRKEREVATGEEQARIDSGIEKFLEDRATLDRQYLEHLADLETLGLDARAARDDLASRLRSRAEDFSGRLRLAAEALASAREREAAVPQDAARTEAVRVAKARLDRTAGSLKQTLDIMSSLDLDTARYQRSLIESTGEISSAIFDREVAAGLFQQWREQFQAWARSNAPTLALRLFLVALVLLLTGLAARVVRHVVERGVNASRTRMTQLARTMVINISGRVVWILGGLVAVSQLGVEVGPLLAGLGVAGFIIGFALQDTLGNFAAGAMLLIYRPYDVGHVVEVAGGVFGSVSKQTLVSTTILTFDNQTLVIPNSKIWGDVIKNVSAQETRRVDMTFGVSYGDDIRRAEQIFQAIVKEHPKVLAEPAPIVRVHELGDSSVNFIVRPWAKSQDYWDVYWDVTREVKLRLDREGISIPFPQRDVHLYSAPNQPPAARREEGAA